MHAHARLQNEENWSKLIMYYDVLLRQIQYIFVVTYSVVGYII